MPTAVNHVDESRRLFDNQSEYISLIHKRRSSGPEAESPTRKRHDRISTGEILAFALPSLALAAQYLPTHVHVFKFYTDVLLVPAGSLAVGTSIARAVDCILDPFVGWLSDITVSPWGRRKPYIFLSLPINVVCYWLLFAPDRQIEPLAAAQWFTFFFFMYLAVPLSLPYQSLGAELTSNNTDRVRLFTWAEVFDKIGIIFASLLPSMLLVLYDNDRRNAYGETAVIIATISAISFTVLLIVVDEPLSNANDASGSTSQATPALFVPGVRRALRNSPFRILLLAASIGSISHAMTNVVFSYYIACVLRVPNAEGFMGYALSAFFVPSALSLPAWKYLSQHWDTRTAWLCGWALHIPVTFALFFLGPDDVGKFLVVTMLMGVCYGGMFLSKIMLSDAIDYEEIRSGSRCEGQFIAWINLIPKLAIIPASSIPLVVLSLTGYVPNQAEQNDQVTRALRVMISFLPAMLSTITLIIAYAYPITHSVQARIQSIISSQSAVRRTIVIDPIDGELLYPILNFSMDMDYFSRSELQQLVNNDWAVVRNRMIISVVMWLSAMIISLALACGLFSFNTSELVIVLAVCTFSFSIGMTAFHLFRLRALYDFDSEAHMKLTGCFQQLIRRHS